MTLAVCLCMIHAAFAWEGHKCVLCACHRASSLFSEENALPDSLSLSLSIFLCRLSLSLELCPCLCLCICLSVSLSFSVIMSRMSVCPSLLSLCFRLDPHLLSSWSHLSRLVSVYVSVFLGVIMSRMSVCPSLSLLSFGSSSSLSPACPSIGWSLSMFLSFSVLLGPECHVCPSLSLSFGSSSSLFPLPCIYQDCGSNPGRLGKP